MVTSVNPGLSVAATAGRTSAATAASSNAHRARIRNAVDTSDSSVPGREEDSIDPLGGHGKLDLE